MFQRPQHLMTRFARERRVFFFEEPVYDAAHATLDVKRGDDGVWVVVPHLPAGLSAVAMEIAQAHLLDGFFREHRIEDYLLWYYSPMHLAFTQQLKPRLVIYDCMDELSLFKGAPPLLRQRELELFSRAHLVFAGGARLYQAKRTQHHDVHLFPSSIDRQHFAQARQFKTEPSDQTPIPHPRLGFFGVVDERMDLDLLQAIAQRKPEWQIVVIGPVVKIEPEGLPRLPNIHYLGAKSYQQLPMYLGGWDVALLPFAQNDATRYISPTKTPEYLAGGKPVVSTPIRDVIQPYGNLGLVAIGNDADEFIAHIERALNLRGERKEWLHRVDEFLAQNSWDLTWSRMRHLIEARLAERESVVALPSMMQTAVGISK